MDKLKITKVDSVLIQGRDQPCRSATLHLTQHHLIFTFHQEQQQQLANQKEDTTSTLSNPTTSSSTSSSTSNAQTLTQTKDLWISYPLLSQVTRLPSLSPPKSSKKSTFHSQQQQSSTQSSTSDSFSSRNQSQSTYVSNPQKPRRTTLKNTSSYNHSSKIFPLGIKTRLFQSYTVGFKDEGTVIDVFESMKNCREIATLSQLYAFYCAPTSPATPQSRSCSSHWSVYDFRQEFSRQGVGSRTKAWRYCDLNVNYDLCPTYPSQMIIPSRISDTTLGYASKYRSKTRLPVLSYLHWANLGSITRSSQPMVGLKQNRSVQDEKLIEAIFTSHLFEDPHSVAAATSAAVSNSNTHQSNSLVYGATTTNLIIDARPTTNAVANVAKGAGTENMDHYRGCKKVYLGVENIHVMRDSLAKVIEVLNQSEKVGTFGMGLKTGIEGDEETSSSSNLINGNYSQNLPLDLIALKKSNWLKHISSLLEGTLLIVKNIHINSSHVLIHCSDGWDRTSQLSALAQILLDPYYRTMKGFVVLLEKDWGSFGHRFEDRSGHKGGVAKFSTDPRCEKNEEEENSENEEEDGSEGDGSEKIKNRDQSGENGGGFEAQAAQAFWGFTKQLQAGFQNASSSSNSGYSSKSNIKETSPVFHQFLDCVFQLMEMFPQRFQFNESWLREILREVYDCEKGNFLVNNERERRVERIGERTKDVWKELLLSEEVIQQEFEKKGEAAKKKEDAEERSQVAHKEEVKEELHPWINGDYDPSLDDASNFSSDMGVLLPNPRQVKFWFQLFGRKDHEMNSLIYLEEEERLRKKEEALRLAEKEREKAESKRREKEEEEEREKEERIRAKAKMLDSSEASMNSIGPVVEGSRDDPLIASGSNVPGTSPGTIRAGAVDLSTSRFDSSKLAYKARVRPSLAERLSAASSRSGSGPTPVASNANSTTSLPFAPINNNSDASLTSKLSSSSSNIQTTSSSNSPFGYDSQAESDVWYSSTSANATTQDPWQAQNMKKMIIGGWGMLQDAVSGVSSPSSSANDNSTLPTSTSTESGSGSGFMALKDAGPLQTRKFKNQENPFTRHSTFDALNGGAQSKGGSSDVSDSNEFAVERKSSPFGIQRNEWQAPRVSKGGLEGLTLEEERVSSKSKIGNDSRIGTSKLSDRKTEVGSGFGGGDAREVKQTTYDPLGVGL